MSDCLLLADTIQAFRRFCMKHYKLEILYYYSLPGYSFNSFLLQTKKKLPLLTDPTMLYFFLNSVKGGIASIFQRRVCANHGKLKENYNPALDKVYIKCYDAISLYSHAMTQPLPDGEFSL